MSGVKQWEGGGVERWGGCGGEAPDLSQPATHSTPLADRSGACEVEQGRVGACVHGRVCACVCVCACVLYMCIVYMCVCVCACVCARVCLCVCMCRVCLCPCLLLCLCLSASVSVRAPVHPTKCPPPPSALHPVAVLIAEPCSTPHGLAQPLRANWPSTLHQSHSGFAHKECKAAPQHTS